MAKRTYFGPKENLLDEEDAYAREPERREPKHTSAVFRSPGLDTSTIIRSRDRISDDHGCTITALDQGRPVQGPKAPPQLQQRATDEVRERRLGMGAKGGRADRNFDHLVERSNW